MLYDRTYEEGIGDYLNEAERVMSSITLDSLLYSLYVKSYDKSKVESMNLVLADGVTKVEREYNRMKEYGRVFLEEFATDNNKCYEGWELLVSKMRSSWSRTKDICHKFCRRIPTDEKRMRTMRGLPMPNAFQRTLLSSENSQRVCFGLNVYPDCVSTLFNLMMRFSQKALRIIALCRSIAMQEEEVRRNPEYARMLYERFKSRYLRMFSPCLNALVAEKINCSESLLSLRSDNPSDIDFAPKAYHKYNRPDVGNLVAKELCVEYQHSGLTPDEQFLWGADNPQWVKTIRRIIEEFDTLLPKDIHFRRNVLPGKYVAMMMHWCGVNYCNGQVEKVFVRYFTEHYTKHGNYTVPNYSTVNKAKNRIKDMESDKDYSRFKVSLNIYRSKVQEVL